MELHYMFLVTMGLVIFFIAHAILGKVFRGTTVNRLFILGLLYFVATTVQGGISVLFWFVFTIYGVYFVFATFLGMLKGIFSVSGIFQFLLGYFAADSVMNKIRK